MPKRAKRLHKRESNFMVGTLYGDGRWRGYRAVGKIAKSVTSDG